MSPRKNGSTHNDNRSSREIYQEIERTREDMDHTLDELGERLHPKHLLDEVLDLFRSDGTQGASTQRIRSTGKQIIHRIKYHPIPALLCGAGLVWLLLDDEERPQRRAMRKKWGDLADYSVPPEDSDVDDAYGRTWSGAAAWHDDYDWSDTHEDQESWSERAKHVIGDLTSSLSDAQLGAREKIRKAAAKLMSISGRKRSEIHSQWADIPEHSGSFVDARTGEPYDDTYGEEWRTLAACDLAASDRSQHDENDQQWSQWASDTVARMQETLQDTSKSAKEQFQALAGHISNFMSRTQSASSRLGRKAGSGLARAGSGISRAGRATGRGMRSGMGGMRSGMGAARRSARSGYESSREMLQETMEQRPLVVGAAMLGAGLLAGLLLPHTRQEDRQFGPTADRLKRRARRTAADAMHRGEEVGRAAASAAMDEMEQQGITPKQIGEKAREAVSRVTETAGEQIPSTSSVGEKVAKVAERAKNAAQEETREQTQDM